MQTKLRPSVSCVRSITGSLALAFGSLFFSSAVHAQVYDHIIPLTQTYVDGAVLGVQPGDVIGIEAGTRGRIQLSNIHGTSSQPVKIVNKGGRVRISSRVENDGITVLGSSHFELRGDGAPGIRYGIEIFEADGQGVEVTGLSTNFEICFLEIYNTGFAGIMAKTDPESDPATQRPNFVQEDTRIHDNYVHHIPGEGFYIGNSFYSGTTQGYLPHELHGVRVYNNITHHTGREGVQVGCATIDCEIYNNRIYDAGFLQLPNHQSGLQLSEGTSGKCYNNVIIWSRANGIVALGIGNNLIYNNVIARSGTNGIFNDNRAATIPGSYFRVYNNTIVDAALYGFNTMNELSVTEFKNNIVVAPTSYTSGSISIAASNNVHRVVADINQLAFLNPDLTAYNPPTTPFNPLDDDYRIAVSSPAVNAGTNLSANGVTVDREGLARPAGGAYDAGAHETGALSVDFAITHPTGFALATGAVTAIPTGGTPPYSYAWTGGGTSASRTNLADGTYTVTVTDSASNVAVRDVTLVEPTQIIVIQDVTPELGTASDGTIALDITGGAPKFNGFTVPFASLYSVAWAHGPTTRAISGLSAGYYDFTVTDANGITSAGTVHVRNAGTPIFRVNNGGAMEPDRVIQWERDKSTGVDKSPYVLGSDTTTSGPNLWEGDNRTEGPDNLFGSIRELKPTPSNIMAWEFPITTSGYYEVQLYFSDTKSAVQPGQRVFDVQIEGATVLDNFDIAAVHGIQIPSFHRFTTHVTDGWLDLDFIRVTGNPIINGIAIHSLGTTLPAGTPIIRINNGGIEETATPINWLLDKQSTPSTYLASTGQLTTGSNSWNSGGTNLTDAPDDLFGSYRYDPSTGQEMAWEFPLAAGTYRLNLYFIERDVTVTGANQRLFDVEVEGVVIWNDYDVYAEQGGALKPGSVSETFEITDGTLNLRFLHVAGKKDPIVSGLSIHRID